MITSTANQHIKAIRKLSRKKYRNESGLFYVEGLRQVTSAIKHQAKFEWLIYCDELLVSDFGRQTLEKARGQGISLLEVSREVFESISLKEGPQGFAAVIHQNASKLRIEESLDGLWVALEGVQDPGNLGSVMRSLDAVGGKGLIVVGATSTDFFHPTSVRASMGAIFNLDLLITDIEGLKNWQETQKLPVIGTVCGPVEDYRGYNYAQDMVLLMGSEQKGLPDEAIEICTDLVTIPMVGSIDSLNLANATTVLLYEIFNQHHPLGKS